MTTSALKAWGLSLKFDGVTIGEITSLSGTRNRSMIDVFSCDSADEAVERLTSGLDEGTPTFGFVYQPGNAQNYNTLNDKYLQGKKGTLLITLATPTTGSAPTLSVTAVISSLSYPQFGSAREVLMGEVGFQTSGKVTYKDSGGGTASASPSASVSSSAST